MIPRDRDPARIAEDAKLDGEARAIARAPLCPDEGQVFGAEHVVPGHLGGIGRDGEQADTLLGRTTGRDGA